LPFPGQLLFRNETVGFWQVRDLSCKPVPHVDVHVVQADQSVHPIAPASVDVIHLPDKYALMQLDKTINIIEQLQ